MGLVARGTTHVIGELEPSVPLFPPDLWGERRAEGRELELEFDHQWSVISLILPV